MLRVDTEQNTQNLRLHGAAIPGGEDSEEISKSAIYRMLISIKEKNKAG